jgi:hypothetical protein
VLAVAESHPSWLRRARVMVRSKRDRAAPGPVLGSVYLWTVALISIAVLAILASTSQGGPAPLGLAIELVLLGAIAQHFPLPVGPQHKIDTSIAVYFACVLLFDTPAAVVVVGVSQVLGQATLALRRVPGTGKRMRGARGVLFNTSQLVLATVLCSLVYNAVLPHAGPAPLDAPKISGRSRPQLWPCTWPTMCPWR